MTSLRVMVHHVISSHGPWRHDEPDTWLVMTWRDVSSDKSCPYQTHQICIAGWRRLIGSPKLQIILHKRATEYWALLWKMTYKDKGSYESSPPCASLFNSDTNSRRELPATHSERPCAYIVHEVSHTDRSDDTSLLQNIVFFIGLYCTWGVPHTHEVSHTLSVSIRHITSAVRVLSCRSLAEYRLF